MRNTVMHHHRSGVFPNPPGERATADDTRPGRPVEGDEPAERVAGHGEAAPPQLAEELLTMSGHCLRSPTAGGGDSPWPAGRTAMTSRSAASPGDDGVPAWRRWPSPWMSTSGAPFPVRA